MELKFNEISLSFVSKIQQDLVVRFENSTRSRRSFRKFNEISSFEKKDNENSLNFNSIYLTLCRSQWPRGLRRRSAAARLLRSWVRIPPGAWIFVCCECWVLSGRGLCDELITRPEESYRLWCVVVFDLETSRMRRP